MFKSKRKIIVIVLFCIILLMATIYLFGIKVKKTFTNNSGKYSVSIPLNWFVKNQDSKLCNGNDFSDFISLFHADGYQGFEIFICIYKNITIEEHLKVINPYGTRITPMMNNISGLVPTWYVGNGIIGELNTVIITNKNNVYRISFWLPNPSNKTYYNNEKKKALEFLRNFKLVNN